jgi:hypothetical protein
VSNHPLLAGNHVTTRETDAQAQNPCLGMGPLGREQTVGNGSGVGPDVYLVEGFRPFHTLLFSLVFSLRNTSNTI